MSNNQLPAATVERIKADAEAATDKEEVRPKALNQEYGRMVSQLNGHEIGYIAGATALAENIQPIIDALDQFISFHETGLLPARHVYEKAIAARKQWKEGKEPVKEQSCTCGEESRKEHGACYKCVYY